MTPSQIFAAIAALFRQKELQALLGPLSTAAANIAKNPTAINSVMQLTEFFVAFVAAQPNIAQAELQLIANDIAASAAAAANSPVTPAA
jgi:hypothetical protein